MCKMRYLVIKKSDWPASIHGETIGIVTIPKGVFVDSVHPIKEGVYVFDISESEWTSYQALELFPEYEIHPHEIPPVGTVLIYNPALHYADGTGQLKAK